MAIEDYALIGDTRTAALVSKRGRSTGYVSPGSIPARVSRRSRENRVTEGVFLLCSFWLADNYALMGREQQARALLERLLAFVGLLAEEYDPAARHLLGNFPQAFSHVGLVNTAFNLTPRHRAPARERESS